VRLASVKNGCRCVIQERKRKTMSDVTAEKRKTEETGGSEKSVVLSIRGMCKFFGRNRVLDHVNLDVKEGTVLGLMGENGAGKSTMMNCLFGKNQRNEGKIFLCGREVSFSSPKEALENGIAMVHQELNQCLEMNVLDNLYLGRYPKNSFGVVDESRMEQEAGALFRRLNMTVNLRTPMKTMSVSERQMVEIAKAVSYDARLIVLDEPTSSLTLNEVDKLFGIMRTLKAQGISFIYISHKMDEIHEICDEIAVLRDGRLIAVKSAEEFSMNELIAAMVGRPLESRFPPVENTPGNVVLSVERLCTRSTPALKDITFDVREGEIFGLYGLVGSGRTEILETIFGMRPRAAGRVLLKGRIMDFAEPSDAIAHGFALITEERIATGVFGIGDLTMNMTISNLKNYRIARRIPVISEKRMVDATASEIRAMKIKCIGPSDPIRALSGGNQQKVIFGRWLEKDPEIFMMDEPTRGVDVGAKYEIYELILQMSRKGKSIILVSSEMPELLGITHRIGVMSDGKLAGIVETSKTSQEELLRLGTEYL